MTESFLHYIWQFQYFTKKDLCTTAGETIQIVHPGVRNTHAGPDFSEAKVKIGDLEWRGSVEIHIKASGWIDHSHGDDAAYEKVILHVVWENDKPISRSDNSSMPTLELKNRVDSSLWSRYKKLFTSAERIPCASSWRKVDDLVKLSMLDKALTQRLEVKAGVVIEMLKRNQGDWEETAYQLLCKNFGFKVNTDSFQRLAESLPYKIVLKHIDKLHHVEALLFGQAGFLEKVKIDEHSQVLVREFKLLEKKYGLKDKRLHKSQWRFLRLRPANFPSVRLAQLAAVIHQRKNIFSTIVNTTDYKDLYAWLSVHQSDYWKTHYQFGKMTKSVPVLGKSSIQNLIINTVVPLLVAYAITHDDYSYMDRAVDWLQKIPAEKNIITRQWAELGYAAKTSFDSQALIELYNAYCMKRRCLECTVGASIIRPV
ncbi:MAG: DUF2851 family protein [Cyclobacteriaceae bacterium]|nr:DUF2851 family protein [Cyclobacteriaceae bacterium]UYN86186.1 MAG: DUF2851 family protein [Cyclobacteriaceae bacterium]